ncbi:MAG: class I SAM-dependent rRNA methyltransferase [Thermoguttaceae bacterium]
MTLSRVILKPHKARPFYARHPWVLDSAIERIEGQAADGDVVDLMSDKGKFVARGLYNSRSRIRVRLYTWDVAEPLDDSFWRGRLEKAVQFRRQLGYDDPQGAARLVFSEGDGLSGLIVDRYADYLAVQVNALALAVRLPLIVSCLVELTGARGVVLRTERGINRAEGLELRDGPYCGQALDGPLEIAENGLRYSVDLAEGQKTGFYLDHRENRKIAARYLRGCRVLDMFCYSGGFSLAASLLGGAKEVVAVDSSAKALALAEANARLNSATNIRFQCGEGFESLESLAAAGQRFDAVILDPPKFARTRGAVKNALQAYHWLNRLALAVLEPGGILITCSCSGHVSREDFLYMLVGAARQTRRDIQILDIRGAAPDHPVLCSCLESEYLKCFICRAI